jgi:hypothetical protein
MVMAVLINILLILCVSLSTVGVYLASRTLSAFVFRNLTLPDSFITSSALFATATIWTVCTYVFFVGFGGSSGPTSRLPVTVITPDDYFGQVSRCSSLFIHSYSDPSIPPHAAAVAVTYATSDTLEFDVNFDGRSPNLALRDRGYRERLKLRVSISRPFLRPDRAQVDVAVLTARQTPWPDNDQSVDDSKFGAFEAAQDWMLREFVERYSTFLSQCIGRDVREERL